MEQATGHHQKHPAKRFYIPPDLRPLGSYAVVIINDMRAAFRSRMSQQRAKVTT